MEPVPTVPAVTRLATFALALALALALGGCDCDHRPTARMRSDCHFERARAALQARDLEAARAVLGDVADPVERDLLRVRLATDDPRHGADLCREVTTDAARDSCRQVLGRPHLTGPRR